MNSKHLIAATLALVSTCLLADTNTVTKTKEQRRAEVLARGEANRLRMQKEFGGFVVDPASQKGKISIVNVQKTVPSADLMKVLSFFKQRNFEYRIEIVQGESFTLASAPDIRAKQEANLAVFIVDDPAQPTMLTAPDEAWAMVNVAKLKADAPTPAYIAARTRKMILRALAYMTAGSPNDAPLVNAFKKGPAELDEIARPVFPIDVIMRMSRYLNDIGVTSKARTTYRAAIQAGHNIQPTNEFQKAIWDDVHAIPEKPLKIKFDGEQKKGVVEKQD